MERWWFLLLLLGVIVVAGCSLQLPLINLEKGGKIVPDDISPKELTSSPTLTTANTTATSRNINVYLRPEVVSFVDILGREGFSPEEMHVRKGNSITWTNKDSEGRDVELVFQKGRLPEFITSPIIRVGGKYTHTFRQKGTYDYWTTGYGTRGKVIVE